MSRVSSAGPETAALASQITARDQLDLQKRQLGLEAQRLKLQQQQQQIELEGMKQQGEIAREQISSQEQQTAAELAQRTYFANERFRSEERQQQAGFEQQQTMFERAAEETAKEAEKNRRFQMEQYIRGEMSALEAESRMREMNSAKFRAMMAAKVADMKARGETDRARQLIGQISTDISSRIQQAQNSQEQVGFVREGLAEITDGVTDVFSGLLVQRAGQVGNAVVERDLTGRQRSIPAGYRGEITWDIADYEAADREYREAATGGSSFWRPVTATAEFLGLKTPQEDVGFGFARTRVEGIPPEESARLILLETSRRLASTFGEGVSSQDLASAFQVVESLANGSVQDPNLARQEIEQLTGGRAGLLLETVSELRQQLSERTSMADLESRFSKADFKALSDAAGGRENLRELLEATDQTAKRLFQFEDAMKRAGLTRPDDAIEDLLQLEGLADQLGFMDSITPEAVGILREAGFGEEAERLQRAIEASRFAAEAGVQEEFAQFGAGLVGAQGGVDAELLRLREELAALRGEGE